ncbi:MAG TPA: hypothetical protein VF170_05450, partial [Planctomycetaceae bacterium]
FPLFPHASGRWAKKIRGSLRYFGKVAGDPEGAAALARWLDQKDDLLAGRKPRDKSDGLTVRDLVNRFLTSKRHLVDTRELSPRTFTGYHATCLRAAETLGKARTVAELRADDFVALRADLARDPRAVRPRERDPTRPDPFQVRL